MNGDGGTREPNVAAIVWRQLRPTPRQETGQRGRLVVTVLVLASFGPYVSGQLRTEQFAVYGLLATIGFIQLSSLQIPRLPVRAWVLFTAWSTYVTIAAISEIGTPPPTSWVPGSLVAAVDNAVAPVAVLLLVWSTVTAAGAEGALTLAARLISVGMALNGALAVVATRVDLTELLRPFWSGGIGITTAEKAGSMGRFSGVFNQPAEAGLAYGIAALCAWYVWRERPRLFYPAIMLIVLGGLIAISKVFILGGLPVILWLLLRGARTRLTAIFASSFATLGVVQSGIIDGWVGADVLGRLLRPAEDKNLLTLFTARRFGEGSTLSAMFEQVWDVSPWWGVGIRGLAIAYDNAWFAAFIIAGAIGVIAFGAAVVAMLVIARRETLSARRTFATCLVVVIVGGTMGFPALTANRVTTFVWVLVGLIALGQASIRSDEESTRQAPVAGNA